MIKCEIINNLYILLIPTLNLCICILYYIKSLREPRKSKGSHFEMVF